MNAPDAEGDKETPLHVLFLSFKHGQGCQKVANFVAVRRSVVAVLEQAWPCPISPPAGQFAVLLVSEDGNATLWPHFGSQAGVEPLTSRIPGRVTALAPGNGAGGPIAAAGMEDGTVHLLAAWGESGSGRAQGQTQVSR